MNRTGKQTSPEVLTATWVGQNRMANLIKYLSEQDGKCQGVNKKQLLHLSINVVHQCGALASTSQENQVPKLTI